MSHLDPAAQALIDDSKASGEPNAHLLPVPQARERFERTFAALRKPEVYATREVKIPARDGMEIPGRLYLPSEDPEPGIIIYYHGGGWLLGSIDSHDATTRMLANATGIAVLSVGYRRGPDFRFPVAVHDAIDAFDWATSQKNPLKVTAPNISAVAGDSAGGNLAAAVAIERGGPGSNIKHQLLAYPVTTTDLRIGTDPRFDGIMLEFDELLWHRNNYLSHTDEASDPRVDVLNADLAGVAPATIVLAECDPIRPQGEMYAEKLKEAGVEVCLREFPGMIHGFFGLDELFPDATEAMLLAAQQLKAAMR